MGRLKQIVTQHNQERLFVIVLGGTLTTAGAGRYGLLLQEDYSCLVQEGLIEIYLFYLPTCV